MKPTLSLQWHITTECDLRCKHCYIYNSPESEIEIRGSKNINLSILENIAHNFKQSCDRLNATPKIFLTGGDPLLSPYFWDLLHYLKSLNIDVAIMGNPYHVTKEVAQKLNSFNIMSYQMSLDGLENTHDNFRKKGSFKSTLSAADILQENNIHVSIMSTISKENASELPELTKLIVERGISSCAFARYCPTSMESTKDIFQPTDYKDFLSSMWDIYDHYWDNRTEFILKDHLWYLFLSENNLFSPTLTNDQIVAGCGMAASHMTVLSDGTVYACRRFKSPVGKVPNQRFDIIFRNSTMKEYSTRSNYEKCSDCYLFYYCRGCSAVSSCVTGSWKSPDPQCWK